MDQQVILNFKKLYIKALFERCFEVTEGINITLREFWKNHFHTENCLKIIDKAWDGVAKRTLNSAWRKLWSASRGLLMKMGCPLSMKLCPCGIPWDWR
jgi:hypothetical protein